MSEPVLFAPLAFSRYEASQTLPEKFTRLLKRSGLGGLVENKTVAIKMHVGGGINYSTIPPVFVRKLVSFIQESGGDCFITDHYVRQRHPEHRGYTENSLGCPVLEACGYLGQYYYTREVDYKKLQHIDVAGLINDADFLIDFSHVKGHGSCGYGGACKNIAMGCVTDRTRRQLHSLEGGLLWDEAKCIHCGKCIESCNHNANSFSEKGFKGTYEVNYHHCTLCQHCVKVCPTGAITLDSHDYRDFQKGMAICTKEVLATFEPENIYYINFLTAITALCDCWGMTTPSLVPDIGIMAGKDLVAVEKACLDAIKIEDLIPAGIPQGHKMNGEGHLFQQLHGKDPYVQLEELENVGLGNQKYELLTIK